MRKLVTATCVAAAAWWASATWWRSTQRTPATPATPWPPVPLPAASDLGPASAAGGHDPGSGPQ